jgi:hypothetical protein
VTWQVTPDDRTTAAAVVTFYAGYNDDLIEAVADLLARERHRALAPVRALAAEYADMADLPFSGAFVAGEIRNAVGDLSAQCACWQGDETPSPAHSPLCSLHSGCGKR